MFQTNRYFIAITLLFIFCPPIFTKSTTSHPKKPSVEQSTQEHEIFQHFMTEARAQTQTIGWSIQQLFQTINAGKLRLTPSQKNLVIKELTEIQTLTNLMLEQLFVQTTKEAVFQGILINSVMIDYLINILSSDIAHIKASTFYDLLEKRKQIPLTEEQMFNIAQINQAKIDSLVNVADHIGLHWYHHFYRSLKRNNAYSIAKGVGIAALTATVAAIALCLYDHPTHNSWYNKWIGANPQKIAGEIGYYVYQRNEDLTVQLANDNNIPNDSNNHKKALYNFLAPEDQTPIQRLITTMGALQAVGLLATSAMLTLDYKNLFSSMYQNAFDWAHEKTAKTLYNVDQNLQGTAKQNIGKNGYEKVYFKDMVGCEELEILAKKISNFMKHPERYERAQIEEHRGILLYGPPQTGKTLFAKALRTLIDEELGDDQHIHFIDAKALYDVNGWSVEYIFWYATFYAPCIIFFDEIDLIGTHRDKKPESTSQLLTCMQGIDMASKQIIVIGATNRPEQIDKALLVDGRFGKIIHIEYPKYQDRKTYLEQQLAKRCIALNPEYIDYIAQETDGCSYNNLKRIITEAIILSSIETRQVTQYDFEKTLDCEVRHIQPTKTMSEQERKIVAIYQAGKAVARHLLHTAQEVVKITINPVIKEVKTTDVSLVIDSKAEKTSENTKLAENKKEPRTKLGEVFTKCSANHNELLSDSEQEKECLSLLAGIAALKLILKDSFTQCNKHDRAEVMNMIYGMISQGEKIDDKLKTQALAIKERYETQVFELLQNNQELLEKIVNKLMQQTTIDRYEWKELVS